MKNTALVIIDVQNDYFSGGKMALEQSEEAAANISQLLEAMRNREAPVFHIQHESIKEGATFFIPGSEGQKIHPSVAPIGNEVIITKNFPNSFLQTDLHTRLQQLKIEKLIITGMMTFMCIDATTRAAKDLGFFCTLVHDCTATPPTEYNGISCTAEQARSAFLCSLSNICDEMSSTIDILRKDGVGK